MDRQAQIEAGETEQFGAICVLVEDYMFECERFVDGAENGDEIKRMRARIILAASYLAKSEGLGV